MARPPEFEVCVETLQACHAAAEGGADRLEVCAALAEGGVTPSRGFLRAAIAASARPVHALLRPRTGDFVYTPAEFDVLQGDLEDALALGAAGVVLGILTASGEIDGPRTAALVRLAGDRPVTFHRAFDRTPDLPHSLEVLADLGCARVLTSGGQPTVTQGLAMLERLAAQAAGRLRIAAGGGVRLANAARLAQIPGLDLHASLLTPTPQRATDPLWNPDPSPRLLRVEDVRALSVIVHAQNLP